MAVELVDPRRALEVVSRNLSLPCRDRWLELVVIGVGCLVLTSPSGCAPLRPICFMSSKASPAPYRSRWRSGMILFSTRMSSSGRLRCFRNQATDAPHTQAVAKTPFLRVENAAAVVSKRANMIRGQMIESRCLSLGSIMCDPVTAHV